MAPTWKTGERRLLDSDLSGPAYRSVISEAKSHRKFGKTVALVPFISKAPKELSPAEIRGILVRLASPVLSWVIF